MGRSIKDAILDAAERRIRATGYHGFSFREIAQDVGIKSASVHYHFPTKSDLVAETARRYTERFVQLLGDPRDERPSEDKLSTLVNAFRKAMTQDRLMCLCGALGTELSGVPDPVVSSTREFFVTLGTWIEDVVESSSEENPRRRAMNILATLEGALLIARSLDSIEAFEQAVAGL